MAAPKKAPWQIWPTPHAEDDLTYLKRHHKAVRQYVRNKLLPSLVRNPNQGEPLESPFDGVLAVHFWNDGWRLAFTLDESDPLVPKIRILAVGRKDGGFYEALADRIAELP